MPQQTPSLSTQVLRMFLSVDRKHRGAVERQMSRLGVHRSQHMVLMYLSHCPAPPTQADIAEEFGISPASVAVTLQKLHTAGFIERLPRKGNSRANDIRLTEAGMNIVRQSHALFHEVEQQLCVGVSDEELESLLTILMKMDRNLEDPDRKPSHPRP